LAWLLNSWLLIVKDRFHKPQVTDSARLAEVESNEGWVSRNCFRIPANVFLQLGVRVVLWTRPQFPVFEFAAVVAPAPLGAVTPNRASRG
jgi:hypothetical protein